MKPKNNYLRVFIIVVAIAAVCCAIYFSFPAIAHTAAYIINLFLPFIIGYIYTRCVGPAVRFFNKKARLPIWLSSILVMFLSIGVIGGIVSLLIMKVLDEIRNIYTQFPIIYQEIENTVINTKLQLSGLFESLPENIRVSMQALGVNITSWISEFINRQSLPMISYAGATARALPKVFIGLIVFLLSSFFMLTEPDKFSGLFTHVIPARVTDAWRRVKNEIRVYIGGYVKAQGIIMSVVFCVLFIGLSVLNVTYALLIAIGVAFLDALPFFGSGAVLWPWALIRFINGDIRMGIGLMIIYVSIVLTRQFIEPKLVSQKMGTNSLVTLMSMYIGYRVLSIGGMILGPITMLLILSFYKAGLFNGIISFIKLSVKIIKREFADFKNKINELGE